MVLITAKMAFIFKIVIGQEQLSVEWYAEKFGDGVLTVNVK